MKKLILLIQSLIISTAVYAADDPIEFTVMHAPGGVSDIVTRYVAKELPTNYNVVNRPGGAGKIAIQQLLSKKSLMLATMVQAYATNSLSSVDLGYDPDKDLAVVATVGIMPSVLVCNKKTEFKTYQDFIRSNKLVSLGVGGIGTSEHLATLVLVNKAKIKATVVPYAQGGGPAISDLIGGHIDCMFGNFPAMRVHFTNPQLVVLMTSHKITTDTASWDQLYNEQFPFQSYLTIVVNANALASTKKQISDDLSTAFNKPSFKEGVKDLGLFPKLSLSPTDINQALASTENVKKFIIENKLVIN